MKRSTRTAWISAAVCCVLALAILLMALLVYPRVGPGVLKRYWAVSAISLVLSALVGYLIAQLAQATVARDAQAKESRLRSHLAEAGHELRTPLAVMSASLDNLRHAIRPGDTSAYTQLDGLQQEVKRMSALVADVLLLARLDVMRRPSNEWIALVPTLEELAAEVRQLEPDRVIAVQAAPGLRVCMDPTMLREIIRNLLDNARKYAPGSPIDLRATADNGMVLIQVGDHGPGMDEEDRILAFERHYRGSTSAGKPGSGLGLAIVQAAVSKHGGSVDLDSQPGRGTCVCVRVPMNQ
ncbi:sensor histidine kinase [Pseudomonas sp. GW6]